MTALSQRYSSNRSSGAAQVTETTSDGSTVSGSTTEAASAAAAWAKATARVLPVPRTPISPGAGNCVACPSLIVVSLIVVAVVLMAAFNPVRRSNRCDAHVAPVPAGLRWVLRRRSE